MELTLTGASLTSDTNNNGVPSPGGTSNAMATSNKKGTPSTGSSVAKGSTPQPKDCCKEKHQQHNHQQHNHQHHKHTAGCPHQKNKNPNVRAIESIPMEKLVLNPPMLFQAILTCIKAGPYETFLYLANGVLAHEQSKGSPIDWGTPISEENEGMSALLRRNAEGHTLSHWAAKRGNDVRFIEFLSKLPHANIHIPSTDAVCMYPIHWAATEGSIRIVAYLISSLSSDEIINVKDKSGCTPLLIASQYGHADMVAFLIQRGADETAVDDSKDTALHWAAYKGSVPVCGLLLHMHHSTKGKSLQNYLDLQDSYGQTPLHLASLRGNVDVVQYLMSYVELYVDKQQHVLSTSIEEGTSLSVTSGESIQLFPSRLLSLLDKEGKSPLDLAIKKKKPACEVVLRDYIDKHVTSNTRMSYLQTIQKYIRPFLKKENWLTWIGITTDIGHVQNSAKILFWLMSFNLFTALCIHVLVYGKHVPNKTLYMWTSIFFVFTITNFLLVHRTDPGLLSIEGINTGFTATNTSSSSSLSPTCTFINRNCTSPRRLCFNNTSWWTSLLSYTCWNENARIKREMEQLTRELRNQYEETLESYASSSTQNYLPLCHSCHIAKPLRSKHCRITNQCILLFDHHCPFVGTTVGLYNYKYFYAFVFGNTILELLFGMTSILYFLSSTTEQMNYPLMLLDIYLFFFMFLSGGICIYHTQLMSKNLTTNEHANYNRLSYLHPKNPFDHGSYNNFKSRFFPWKGSYMLLTTNKTSTGTIDKGGMDSSKSGSSKKEDDETEEEAKDLMLNVV